MKNSLTLVFLLFAVISNAQVTTYPLESNGYLERIYQDHPNYVWGQVNTVNKWGRKDTLELPFFEDFSTSNVYPDSSKWLNNQVFVNSQFPINPPTINVATFDALNPQGRPYNGTINRRLFGPGDSLLSQPINTYDSNGTRYKLSDSLYFSFFYQPNGNGYHLGERDSIRLFFKSENGNWIQVWTKGGTPESKPFRQVLIPITDTGYLHKGFQFLFTTWTKQVGNANQWHIDYIVFNKNRNAGDSFYYDHAFSSQASSLLKDYSVMPLDHYKASPGKENADSIFIDASNLDEDLCVCQVRHEETFGATTLKSTLLTENNVNMPSQSHVLRRFESYNFTNISGQRPVVIDRLYEIEEAGISSINDIRINDQLRTTQVFDDYFAHDDGTAERGFGFDHNTNPSNIEGEIAYRFTLNKADSVYAIGVYFNEAVFDVSREEFTLRIWQHLGGVDTTGGDSLIYESDILTPQYVYQPGRYYIHYIDTQLFLPAGDFYIGWWQQSMYNLNVGWDLNSGNTIHKGESSSFLFYKLFGSWSNANLPEGELMMRPYVGSRREVWLGIEPEAELVNEELEFYPNPAHKQVNFRKHFNKIEILNMQGQVVLSAENQDFINTESLQNGMYVIRAVNTHGNWLQSKLIIFVP
ncbi:T9SS type A sorting domain-containing protein [bacterium]|nr:T9SS type A sorting domain-containing protein [bacterium]